MQPLPPDGGSDSVPLPERPLDRRQFLQLSALGAAGFVGATRLGTKHQKQRVPAKAKAKHASTGHVAVVNKKLASGVIVPTAPWLIAENAKRGTLNWICNFNQPDHALEGFASQVSAVPGDDVAVFVSTTARAVQVQAYRMGYYQGLGGRLIVKTDFVPAKVQAAPVVTPGIGTVTCPWSPTLTLNITKDWLPGCYLLKLVGDGGEEQFVPLTIRDDASKSAYVLQNSVTTWQAYNLWGAYSLYYGPSGKGSSFAGRARAVSFDRPYPQTWASGAADFVGNELPLLFHLESLGLDMTYWTDVDLHAQPQLLMNHRCLFSLGHDEYWSTPMRQGAQTASAGGVNLAFLGANACYRQIRMQSTSVGPNRLQVCYKDAAEDPIAHEQPELTTVNWDQAPVSNPESNLIGSMYQSVGAKADMVVTDASSWFYSGCNLTDGHTFSTVILGEYDRYVPSLPGPKNADVLAHSPVPGQGNWSDITYYTAPGNGGGVLAAGSASFVSLLGNTGAIPPNVIVPAIPGVTDVIRRAMENVYGRFGLGPATSYGASTGNWSAIYTGAAATAGSAAPTPSA
ncbi:MAG TPA: N,N-dimethylformamidase beta subunit family domain-containing protein [Acidimicrobiales bacterium]|nr:N,N-dimethylformamidase beta subunit family domain-containing protein [Acidimicrobiales bacterium]